MKGKAPKLGAEHREEYNARGSNVFKEAERGDDGFKHGGAPKHHAKHKKHGGTMHHEGHEMHKKHGGMAHHEGHEMHEAHGGMAHHAKHKKHHAEHEMHKAHGGEAHHMKHKKHVGSCLLYTSDAADE